MIAVGDKVAVLVRGDYHPAALYIGDRKIAGWREEAYSGTRFDVENTYNDRLCVAVQGRMEQEGSPTPDAPISINRVQNPSVFVGNAETEAVETILFSGDLCGKNGSADTFENDVVVDGVRSSRLTRRWGRVTLDGTEDWIIGGKYVADGSDWYYEWNTQLPDALDASTVDMLCTHYPVAGIFINNLQQGINIVWRRVRVRWGAERPIDEWKAYLAGLHAAGTPLEIIYQLGEPQVILGDPVPLRTLPGSTSVTGTAELAALVKRVDTDV